MGKWEETVIHDPDNNPYLSMIRLERYAKHYAQANHGSPSSLRFYGIEKVTMSKRGGDILKKLSQREMFWIYTQYHDTKWAE